MTSNIAIVMLVSKWFVKVLNHSPPNLFPDDAKKIAHFPVQPGAPVMCFVHCFSGYSARLPELDFV